MKSKRKFLTMGLVAASLTASVCAQSYQLNFRHDGGAAIDASAVAITAAHEDGSLASNETSWNFYQVSETLNAGGVLIFDRTATANNVLIDAQGNDNGVAFRYGEGRNIDFSLGYNDGAQNNGPEDTGNPGDSGTDGNFLYQELWFGRPADEAIALQISGVAAGDYNAYVYSRESNATNRTITVSVQADGDSQSSFSDGALRILPPGNDTGAFVEGTNYARVPVRVEAGENVVIFVTTEVISGNTSTPSFPAVGAIQLVRVQLPDDDNDGMPNEFETANNLDPNDPNDAGQDIETDVDGVTGDGLTNLEEFLAGTDIRDSDSDDDGLTDGEEVNGTLNPFQEGHVAGTTPGGAPGEATSPLNPDTDDDGITDLEEITAGDDSFITNPRSRDTDGDQIPDSFEAVAANSLDPNNPADASISNDSDALSNLEEFQLGTNLNNPDTDNDTIFDHVETGTGTYSFYDAAIQDGDTGTSPLLADTDGDGLNDNEENPFDGITNGEGFFYLSDPNFADFDDDGFLDGLEVANMSDPDNENEIPTFDPVSASLQIDIDGGNGARGFAGVYAPAVGDARTPAHQQGFFNANEVFFNSLTSSALATFSDTLGVAIPSVSAQVGLATDNGGTLSFNFEDGGSGVTGSSNALPEGSIYDTALMRDWVFSRDDQNIVVRLNGLAAGEYHVIAMVREQSEPGRTLDISFGTQIADGSVDPVFSTTSTGAPGAPDDWQQGLNFHSTNITVANDNDYIVVMADGTNSAFASFEGLQIMPASRAVIEAPAGLTVSNIGFENGAFEFTVSGLDTNASYELRRSTDLNGTFEELVGAAFTPTAATQIVSDPNPQVGIRAFYRIEEAQQ